MNIQNKLEIILITYNRKNYLQRTFDQIFADNSPIKNFNITILDNKSTDGTSELIEQYVKIFPNIKHIIHNHNIGGNANIVRAFELASKEYIWVLCDDDVYDWSNWSEVEKAVNNNENIICLSRYALPDPKKTEAQILQLTFVPSNIIKTSFLSDSMIKSMYDNIFAFFPQLLPTIYAVNNKLKIYVVTKPIVHNGMDTRTLDTGYKRGTEVEYISQRNLTMSWIVGYANLCSMIKDSKLKHRTMLYAIKYIHINFSRFCRDMHRLYFEKKNWFQIIDVSSQLDLITKVRLLSSLFRRHFIGANIEHDHFVIRLLLFKIKFNIKKYIEGDYIIIDFNFMKAKKHIDTKYITLNIFNKNFKMK
ncbi:MAG: glycosyltransferase family 2 protein [Bacteroidaceae bacterium]|nr:glycosyltransferase family 2 protein [Bacteroidaceae bacterium]